MHSRLKTIKYLDNQGLISAYTIIFAGCFMLLVYEPILMYATNTDEFWFDFSTMIIPTMAIFVVFMLIGMAASTVVYYINRIYPISSSCEKIDKEFKKVKINSKNMHKNTLLKAEKLCCFKILI